MRKRRKNQGVFSGMHINPLVMGKMISYHGKYQTQGNA